MKLRIFALIIACFILFTACDTPEPADTSDTADASNTADATESLVEDTVDDGYLEIPRRASSTFKLHIFSFEDSKKALKLSLPTDWTLTEMNGGYSINRAGEKIGNIAKGDISDSSQWKVVKKESYGWTEMSVNYFIEKNIGGDTYRHRGIYIYDDNGSWGIVTLTVDYEELDEFGYNKVFDSASVDSINKPATKTDLSHLLKADGSGNFLILGNSFIGSSSIGSILYEMFNVNGKKVYADAMSVGMASVNTYVNHSEVMAQIRRGSYDAVFICGFYGTQAIDSLGILKAACDESRTKLVVFPAHNENASIAATAASSYDSVELLNWKGELDALIASGIDRWDLCVNDYYDHSRPLAGYVGAHLIYRSLFGEVPEKNVSYSIDFNMVKSVLGNYVETGEMVNIDKADIKYIR